MMKRADLLGRRFGQLTVVENLGPVTFGKNTKRIMWLCKCDCGKETTATTNDLNSGKRVSCGCVKLPKRVVEIGDRYGFLKVIGYAGKNKSGRLMYRCICNRCGNETIVQGKTMRNGTTQSCGCLKRDHMSNFGDTNFDDISGKTFGYLKVIDRAQTRISDAGNHTTMWNCECLLCGKKTVVAAGALKTKDHTRSCGCLKMSFAEHDIDVELTRLNIPHDIQYSFDDLVSPTSHFPLRFDFALFDNYGSLNCLIEYQGPQHFMQFSNGFGDFQREVTDPMKKEYCEANGLKLHYICYDDNIIGKLHDIISQTYNITI